MKIEKKLQSAAKKGEHKSLELLPRLLLEMHNGQWTCYPPKQIWQAYKAVIESFARILKKSSTNDDDRRQVTLPAAKV